MGVAMSTKLEYTIAKIDEQFFVMDSDEELVGLFDSEAAAKAEIAAEQLDDVMWDRTKQLIRYTVHTLMAEFGVSQDVALDLVNSGAGITDLGMEGEARP
jgi:hypothetical protein